MSAEHVKIIGQLAAHEYLLQRLYMFTYAGSKATPSQIHESHANIRQMIQTTEWPGADPGVAALAGGEIEDSLNTFLSGLESMLAEAGLLPKGGQG